MMMSPERISLHSLLIPDQTEPSERLRKIVAMIAGGAVFVYPTETIYGIGGSLSVPGVREKIFLAKKRDHAAPLIILASERKYFNRLPLIFPPAAESLAREFWPGMLTLVLPSALEPDGIAVRVSSHPFITALFRYCSAPIYSTSANMSGKPYVNDPDVIFSQFSGVVDFMVDAGPLPGSLPSTIVKVSENNEAEILREGVVPSGKIAAVIKQ
jgi:L-threonylcarbamoyladenylate synthase